jgi:hypothetical protein
VGEPRWILGRRVPRKKTGPELEKQENLIGIRETRKLDQN